MPDGGIRDEKCPVITDQLVDLVRVQYKSLSFNQIRFDLEFYVDQWEEDPDV